MNCSLCWQQCWCQFLLSLTRQLTLPAVTWHFNTHFPKPVYDTAAVKMVHQCCRSVLPWWLALAQVVAATLEAQTSIHQIKPRETCRLFSANKEVLIAASSPSTSSFFLVNLLKCACPCSLLWPCHSTWQAAAPNHHFLTADKTRTKGHSAVRWGDVVE